MQAHFTQVKHGLNNDQVIIKSSRIEMPAIFLLGLLFCLTNFALKIILKYTHLKGAVISDEFPTELSVYLAMTVAGNSDTKLDYFVLEYDSCLCLHLVFVLLLLFHNRCCTLHIYKKIFRK